MKVFSYILVLLALVITSFMLGSYLKDKAVSAHLEETTKAHKKRYNLLYEEHKTLATLIFRGDVNTTEVLSILEAATEDQNSSRKALYEHLKLTYATLKSIHIKQLHFHTAKNESFLRFHRPSLFGDDLSDVRATIKYVNAYLKPIDGFEEGRIYNGYRFVFPLLKEQQHLGSVEVSFSTLAMSQEFINDYNLSSSFLTRKDIINKKLFTSEKGNYEPSCYDEFLVEKAMLQKLEEKFPNRNRQTLSKENLSIANAKILEPDSFSLYDLQRGDITSFIKVQNPISKEIVGVFLIRSDANLIEAEVSYFYIILALLNLFFTLVLFLIYKEDMYRKNMRESYVKLESSREEIKQFNATLASKVRDEVKKNRAKDEQMLQQARLAQMGELLSMIAHQWRQPLSAISATSFDMRTKIELEVLSINSLEEKDEFIRGFIGSLEDIDSLTQRLNSTINDFRNFYKVSQRHEVDSISRPIESAIKIIEVLLRKDGIVLEKNFDEAKKIELHENEVMQVILNIIKNAQDNFKSLEIANPKISITTLNTNSGIVITICDNGGGVPTELLQKIFLPYFSTKEDMNGSGLGLYMSSIIINQHHNGSLSVSNTDKGACFHIEINNIALSEDNKETLEPIE